MAKIKPMVLIDKMSGLVCEHSDTYFAVRYGNVYTGKMCNPRTTPYSADEVKAQQRFKTAHEAAIAKAALPATQAQYKGQYGIDKEYKTLNGLLTHLAYDLAVYDDNTSTWSVTWPAGN